MYSLFGNIKDGIYGKTRLYYIHRDGAKPALLYEAKLPKYKVYHISKLIAYSLRTKMLNSMKKLQMFYAKSPEIRLATSPAEQAVHGILFTFNLRTFGYRLLLLRTGHLVGKQ